MNKIYLCFLLFLLTSFLGASDIGKQHSASNFELLVHKTPTCGCCKMWVNHMEENGFTINTKDHQSLVKIKDELKNLKVGEVYQISKTKHFIRWE